MARGQSPLRFPPVAVGAAALGLTGLMAGCGVRPAHTINPQSAARQISTQLADRYRVPAPEVTCPAGISAATGTTFECQAVLDGQQLPMDGRVTADGGRFTVAPGMPIIVVSSTVTSLENVIRRQTGQPATVSCGVRSVLVAAVHSTFTCSATFAGQDPRLVRVQVVDTQGDVSVSLAPATGA